MQRGCFRSGRRNVEVFTKTMIFRTQTDDFDDIDELYEDIGEDIKKITDYSARYVIQASPVWTGLFKGNWNVSVNVEYDGSFIHEDKDGANTLSKMQSDIAGFHFGADTVMYIQNNVYNEEDKEYYAETVSWDASGARAENILHRATVIGVASVG